MIGDWILAIKNGGNDYGVFTIIKVYLKQILDSNNVLNVAG